MTQSQYRDELDYANVLERLLQQKIDVYASLIKSSLYNTKGLVEHMISMRFMLFNVRSERNKLVRWFHGSRIGTVPRITPIWGTFPFPPTHNS